jgi:two-component system, NarL family, response regulator NreC
MDRNDFRGQPPAKGPRRNRVAFSILIVDDSAQLRYALRSWIEREKDWEICGEAENGKAAVEKVKELRPDVVILDLEMPVMNGLEAGREIAQLSPDTAMVMFTMHCSEQLVKAARAVGIKEVVSKSTGNPDHLLSVLRSACSRD